MTPSAAPLAAFSGYGIELEYMIVDRESLSVLPIADALLRKMAIATPPNERFGWSNELAMHLLEVKNQHPSPTLDAAAEFQAEIERADKMLAQFDARLMPTGMHPWMDPATETRLWPHEDAAIYRTYDGIFDCRAHGWANIQSMQLNLPFADDDEFARLHAATRLLLPILPALAASSPIADGKVRAQLDFRMDCYRRHTARKPTLIGEIVPDNATTLAGYREDVLAPMFAEIAQDDPDGNLREDWLNTRGAIPRFDRRAIEIRVIDMQECPQADLGIAALTAAAARALYGERWSSLERQQEIATQALAAILLDCIREGDAAVIGDAHYLTLLGLPQPRCTARELWHHLRDACSDDPLMSPTARIAVDFVLDNGPLARRILNATGNDPAPERLKLVYGELCDCLAEGRLFAGTP